jgi:hypothetical protein
MKLLPIAALGLVSLGAIASQIYPQAIAQDENTPEVKCDRPELTKVITPDGVSMQSASDEGGIKVQQALLHWCQKAQAEGHLEGAYMSGRDFIASGSFDHIMASEDNYFAIRSVILADGREVSFEEARQIYLQGQEMTEEEAEAVFNAKYRFPTMMANGVIYVAPDSIPQLNQP